MLPSWIMVIFAAFSSYILACLIASSSIFEPIRAVIKRKTIGTIFDKSPKHFIECRLCISCWTSLFCSMFIGVDLFFPIYGISYFLATQER